VSENYEEPRRPVLAVCAIASVLTTVCLLYAASTSTSPRRFLGVAPFAVVSVALVLAWVNSKKFWWATRLVALIIGAAYAGYLIHQLFVSPEPFSIQVPRSRAAPFNAIMGFLFFGVPCFLYAMSGSSRGRAAYVDPAVATKSDRAALSVAIAARWLFVGLSALAGFAGLLRMLH